MYKSPQTYVKNDYAILINGGFDLKNNYLCHWNNLSIMYKLLIEKGYKRENIYVLSSDGTYDSVDSNTVSVYGDEGILFSQGLDLDGDEHKNIDFAVTKV